MIRVPSPLDAVTERYVSEAMECGFVVHRTLGPGFPEATYKNAFCLELQAQNIPFECEKECVIKYRGQPVALFRFDLVVRGSVLVELKAVRAVERAHEAQVLSYLKASRLPVGLLMNFSGATLKEGLRRIILRAE
jgi:GxxExxY protein